MNVLYVTDNLISSSVFKSQVHNICHHHSLNNNVKLLAFCKSSDMSYDEKLNYTLVKSRRPVAFSIPIVSWLTSKFFKYKEILEWADVIHCRGHGPSMIIFNLLDRFSLNKKVIVDIRGALVNEIEESGKNPFLRLLAGEIKKTEKVIFKRADFLFFVSNNMRKHFSNLYEFDYSKTAVFPTIVNEKYFCHMDAERIKIRNELGLNDKFVYVYSGGNSYWQNVESIILKFDQERRNHADIFLLLIVLDKAYFEDLLVKLSVDRTNIKVITLPYEDVGRYLNAGDAGLIIRSKSIVNYVASPTKVNEYLACGLNIVDSLDAIGDKSYNSESYKYNYMSVYSAIAEQECVYQKLK